MPLETGPAPTAAVKARIPFNRPLFEPEDLAAASQALTSDVTSGGGPFGHKAESRLSAIHSGAATLLTSSCSHSLEMAARLLDLRPGDEVIVPAYSFVTSASSFVWNGALPKLVDVDPDHLCLDFEEAKSSISTRTRAICIVNYGGISPDLPKFRSLADDRKIVLIEDNAHGLGAKHDGQTLGTLGDLSTLSFHETKNITCGEGGALVVNNPEFLDEARILRDKGTDRQRFLDGHVDKYTWQSIGSSWVMSDVLAAVLDAQLQRLNEITKARLTIWNRYAAELSEWAHDQGVQLPNVPIGADHPAHVFHLRFSSFETRQRFMDHMDLAGISTVFHYQSLGASPAARKLKLDLRPTPVSDQLASTLVRLPLFLSLSDDEQNRIVNAVKNFRVQ